MSEFHPELKLARFIPDPGHGPVLSKLARRFRVPAARVPDDMVVETVTVPGDSGRPASRLRFYRPKGLAAGSPALLWMHGGGYTMGNVEQDDRRSMTVARELGITVAAVSYRLAPGHPAPAALDDAYACLRYLHTNAAALGIDPGRIAIGGVSAGGGIAAALALLAHDRGEVRPVFQLLCYPVLDDRTPLRTDRDNRNVRIYTAAGHLMSWQSYLGHEPGGPDVSEYAAPARREDLRGLPPAWIGLCAFDVVYDEGVEYANRLNDSGVPCDLHVVEGAFHGFDVLFARTEVARSFRARQLDALRRALFPVE